MIGFFSTSLHHNNNFILVSRTHISSLPLAHAALQTPVLSLFKYTHSGPQLLLLSPNVFTFSSLLVSSPHFLIFSCLLFLSIFLGFHSFLFSPCMSYFLALVSFLFLLFSFPLLLLLSYLRPSTSC